MSIIDDAPAAYETEKPVLTVFAVAYMNYDPPEVDSLWKTRDAAERCAQGYAGMCVIEMQVLE